MESVTEGFLISVTTLTSILSGAYCLDSSHILAMLTLNIRFLEIALGYKFMQKKKRITSSWVAVHDEALGVVWL